MIVQEVCQLWFTFLYAIPVLNLGTVVQSIVSLTSLLTGQLFKCFTTL